MNVIYFLITVSLILGLLFLCAFLWSIKTGQYDDDYGPSVRMLYDDETSHLEIENKEEPK